MPTSPPGGIRLFFVDNPRRHRYNKYNWILSTKSVDTMKKQVEIMYKDEFERWLAYPLDDPDLKPELESVAGDDEAVKDRFAVTLKFGTAGLRGVIGACTNRMNV